MTESIIIAFIDLITMIRRCQAKNHTIHTAYALKDDFVGKQIVNVLYLYCYALSFLRGK